VNYIFNEKDINRVADIVKSSKKIMTPGDITREYFMKYCNNHKIKDKKEELKIKKNILKNFTAKINNELKKYSIFRKRRNNTQQFIYYFIEGNK